MRIKVAKSKDTIVLVYEGKTLNIQRLQSPIEWEKLETLLKDKNEEEIIRLFISVSSSIEEFTKGIFTIDVSSKKVYFRGDKTTPMPQSLISKLKSHFIEKVDTNPLTLFWEKCLQNPSSQSREELFDFLLKNNTPLTEEGDIIVEKGVNKLFDGKLVDCHTGKFDNSIGKIVSIPREEVDSNRDNECSHGLHVGAPDYVRNHWTSDIIVTCIVNPKDVVSVPKDYNATKMRVCEYRVVNYADAFKITPNTLVYKLGDISPKQEVVVTRTFRKKEEESEKQLEIAQPTTIEFAISNLTAKGIKSYILETYGVVITKGDKNKKGIIEEAIKISNLKSGVYTKESLSSFSKNELLTILGRDKGVDVSLFPKKVTKGELITRILDLV